MRPAKQKNSKAGFILTPKDLRDYICTEIAARSNEPNAAMRLMRRSNLATTTKFITAVEDRMREAVQTLGGASKAATGRAMLDLAKLEKIREAAKILENYELSQGKIGGGGQSRTVDAADMSRVL